ncbi:transcriptional regulator [Haloferax sp. Atlit-19N]|uniref:HVO_A0114 family putative DNA-binding protein n=1 Tax=Haloferax TaxID=2251 RepID=UPI0006799868|nr:MULTISPECIES: transcriptional regulator [Haloferax]RDZ43398.1 transcriptional regulator [Haloferax sp. Atlit-19N]
MTKLKVTVGEGNDLDERTRQRLKAAQAGEELEDAQPVLDFDSFAELSRLLSPKNLELLEAISEAEPDSIREAAELVDRDYKQVHRNLTELADIGVIDFEGGGPGLPKKPVLVYDGLEIDLPFNNSNNNVGAAAP